MIAVVALLGALQAGVPRDSLATCGSSRPEWIWCDDFETDRSSAYFEVSAKGGSFLRADGAGRRGSAGMRARFAPGQVDAGALHLAIGRTPARYFRSVSAAPADYREIWWRFWVRLEPGWTGGGGNKLTRAIVFTDSTWAQAAIAHLWSGGPNQQHLVLDPASGTDAAGRVVTTRYNDFAHLRWIGQGSSTQPVFPRLIGAWRCIEAHARLNDPGAANGVFELWVDGAREASRTGLNWVGAYSGYGWNAVFLENYWNRGAPRAEERYFDDFVVSTRPIGCGDS